ncbi:MAG: S8 family peptidase [Thermonemataceae bacterium]
MSIKHIGLLGLICLQTSALWAIPNYLKKIAFQDTTKEEKAPENWFNLDVNDDKIRGVSTEKAYKFLKNKKGQTVIVAVIDSGVDIEHEDLKDVVWVNEDEVAGNQKDDDKNGYVDDVHGWNFIGGADGKNVEQDSYELTREYVRLKAKYGEATPDSKLIKKNQEEYAYYQEVKKDFEKKRKEIEEQQRGFDQFYTMYIQSVGLLKKYLKTDELTFDKVNAVEPTEEEIKRSQGIYNYAYMMGIENEEVMKETKDYFSNTLQYGYNPDFDPRDIVGDDYSDLEERYYGNNDVTGPDATHGTHVAGIIAANRQNEIGMLGVANNVRIMSIRAVPDGDERDKDIANAIRYAVDNGAKIINMSFGKSYSPHKALVDEAVRYAESKGVLLVHAAGNDGKDLERNNNFPNKNYREGKAASAANWLEIGASSWKADRSEFTAEFSNYGSTKVDVFAPGVDLYATVPDQKYKALSGTSMAAPTTSGVAALVMSYYPDLSAKQVKEILMKSSVKYRETKVNLPGSDNKEMVPFGELSVSGGIVNAFEAVKMADAMSQKIDKR